MTAIYFRRSKSFLAQAYESEVCSGSDETCVFDPLSANDLQQLTVLFHYSGHCKETNTFPFFCFNI